VSGVLGTDHALEDRRQARSTKLTALMAKTIVGSAGAQGGARPIPRVRLAAWLIPCCYLAAALVLTWRLWADPASRAQLVAANGDHASVLHHDGLVDGESRIHRNDLAVVKHQVGRLTLRKQIHG